MDVEMCRDSAPTPRLTTPLACHYGAKCDSAARDDAACNDFENLNFNVAPRAPSRRLPGRLTKLR
jgi:hypothetical protein